MHILLITHSFYPETVPRAYKWVPVVSYLSQQYNVRFSVITPKKRGVERGEYKEEGVVLHETQYGFFLTHRLYGYRKNERSNDKSISSLPNKFSIRRIARKVAEYIYFPDQYVEWVPYAFSKALDVMNSTAVDLIVSNAMPFTSHIVGSLLNARTGIPLILEYGDPFSFNPFMKFTPIHLKLARYLEATIIKQASAIIVATPSSRIGFVEHFEIDPKRVHVVPMSYPSTIADRGVTSNAYRNSVSIDRIRLQRQYSSQDNTHPDLSSKYTLVYAGTFYRKKRNPINFLKGLMILKRTAPNVYRNLNVEFYARTPSMNPLLRNYQKKLNQGMMTIKPAMPREKLISVLQNADLLLNFANESIYQMPSKLVEYYMVKRPILTIVPDNVNYVPFVDTEIVCSDVPEEIAKVIAKLAAYDKKNRNPEKVVFREEDFLLSTVGRKYYSIFRAVTGLD